MTPSLSHHQVPQRALNMRTVSALTEVVSVACDDPLTAMMSAANREIRTMERQADERRRRARGARRILPRAQRAGRGPAVANRPTSRHAPHAQRDDGLPLRTGGANPPRAAEGVAL